MARNLRVQKPVEAGEALNRLPYLASPLLRFNLADERKCKGKHTVDTLDHWNSLQMLETLSLYINSYR
jgi:hypothetical protein